MRHQWLAILAVLFGLALGACTKVPALQTFELADNSHPLPPVKVILKKTGSGPEAGALLNCAKFSPDDRQVLVTGSEGLAFIINVDEAHKRVELKGHTGPVSSASWSHDGKHVVTCAYSIQGEADNTLRIWDAHTGLQQREVHAATGMKPTLATFSSDDSLVIWTEQNDSTGKKTVNALSFKTGEQTSTGANRGISMFFETLELSPDDKVVYWLDQSFALNTAPLGLRPLLTYRMPLLAYWPDEQKGYMYAHLFDNDHRERAPHALYEVDLGGGEFTKRLEFKKQPNVLFYSSMAASPDKCVIAIATTKGTILVDVRSHRGLGRCVVSVDPSEDNWILTACFSSDGRLLLATEGSGVYVWDVPQ